MAMSCTIAALPACPEVMAIVDAGVSIWTQLTERDKASIQLGKWLFAVFSHRQTCYANELTACVQEAVRTLICMSLVHAVQAKALF